MTKDIFFNNSNVLYDLNYPFPVDFKINEQPPKSLPWRSSSKTTSNGYDTSLLDHFLKDHPSVSFIYVQWLDYMGTMRTRVVPRPHFEHLIKTGGRIGISKGNTGTLQNDASSEAMNSTGQIYVEPDLNTLRPCQKQGDVEAAMVLAFWRDEDGHPIPQCPRGVLASVVEIISTAHGINILLGFEIEVTFLARIDDSGDPYTPLTKTHAWGTCTPEQWMQMPIFYQIITGLAEAGINIEQFHAESGPGQYEFVLPPLPPLAAIDTLVHARQIIQQIAALHNLRATLHPKPFPSIGTAAHAHISLDPPDHDVQFFVGGVLKHLASICALTMPEAVSYGRVIDDSWTGGTWIAWGTQNRETPLRRVTRGRWEIRCMDGMANMYLAISAVLAAGTLGLEENVDDNALPKDCLRNPSQLSSEERTDLGIEEKLPKDIEESLSALQLDDALADALPPGLTNHFVAMKRAEQKMLEKMGEKERRVWLIERY